MKAAISSNCPAFNLSECDASHTQTWPGSKYLWPGNTRLSFYRPSVRPLSQNWQPTDSYGSSDPCPSTRRRGQSTKRTKTAKHELAGDTAWQNKHKTIQEILARTRDGIQAWMRQAWDRHVQSCTRLCFPDQKSFSAKRAAEQKKTVKERWLAPPATNFQISDWHFAFK